MRTTVTLDSDTEALVKRAMRERGLSFKEAVNDAIRQGLEAGAERGPAQFKTFDMGEPWVDITHALRLASDLEDQELVGKLVRGK